MPEPRTKAPALKKKFDVTELEADEKLNLAIAIGKEGGLKFIDPEDLETLLNGKDWLKKVGDLALQEFKIDLQSRSRWEAAKARELKLFMSHMDPKTWPWEHASNVNLPFTTIACIQYQSRAIEAILPKEITRCVDIGKPNPLRAERCTDYMNYQLRYQMPDFEDGMDKSTMQLGVAGSVFRKSFYDSNMKIVRSTWIPAVDFVVNYGISTLEEAYRKSHVLYFNRNQIRQRVNQGLFVPSAWDLEPGTILHPSQDLKQASDTVQRVEEPEQNRATPRVFVEMHTLLDYDGDGLEEPCVIVFDYESGDVVRLYSRQYYIELDNKKQARTMEYFTDYHFLPNPEGFYGIGLGTLLYGLNEAANTIVNEIIDAGHLANIQGGFVAKRSGIKRGSLRFKMGEYKEVNTYLDDMRKAIYNFDFKGPNDTLYSTLGLLYEYAKLVSSVSETTTGQLPASDTPASTVLALIEEGRKVYSAIHKRTHRSFKKELSKIYRLNSIFISEETYYRVIGTQGYPEGGQQLIARDDFAEDIDVFPVSDPVITSKAEQIIKKKEFQKEIFENPDTKNNPVARQKASILYYKALDVEDAESYFESPEPPDIPAFEENAMFLKEQTAQVLPNQAHLKHIEVHDSLLQGKYANQITPTAKTIIDQHQLEHVAAQYALENQEQIQAEQEEQQVAAQEGAR